MRDYFTAEGRKARALARACAKAKNHLIKTDDRRPALYLLADDGGPEAINGLLSRFTFNYATNVVIDEEEKSFVFEALRTMGERVLPQLKAHLKSSPSLSWALRVLPEICDHEKTFAVLTEILADYDTEYQRDPSRKLQLITFLGELPDPRVTPVLLRFLGDHDETVRYTVVDGLLKQQDENAREPLLQRMIHADEESLRIKHRIAQGFVELEWTVKGFRGSVERVLPEDFFVDSKARIKRKKPRG